LENIGLLLQQKVNISQCHILHFGSRRNQGDYPRLAKEMNLLQREYIPNGGAIFLR
jgi:hypothetical protein